MFKLHHAVARVLVIVLIAPAMHAWAQDSAAPAPAPAPAPAGAPAPTPNPDAGSYGIGLTFGSQLHSAGLDKSVSIEALTRGLTDGLAGKSLSPQDREQAMALMHAGREAVASSNRAEASKFLAQNGAIKGVVTTASGLQYTIIAPGNTKAASPTALDRVTVNYRGRLLDGTEFDSSERHAQAATFTLNGVLKGWREALLMMKPGAQWRLFIPPELAYDANTPPSIPPGSMLVFDVELVKIEAAPVLDSKAGRAHAPKAAIKAPMPDGTKH